MSRPRRVVLTGGPGAGKTAVLEIAKRAFCAHVAVVPEAASILFTGGFPREPELAARTAAQRAIVHVQRQLEAIFDARPGALVLLCDRGTLDSLAYWPGPEAELFAELGTTREAELTRYDAVIHLAPAAADHGYQRNGTRVESAAEAVEIDRRITAAWRGHPRWHSVPCTARFVDKVKRVLDLLDAELPVDCRNGHAPAPATSLAR